jgi:hypothetical protein
MEARAQEGQEVGGGEKRNGSLAAAILAPAVLATCSSDGEGEEGGGAEAFCGDGAEPPVSPQREE